MKKTLSAKNAAFWEKSDAQKRIAVAKDVLRQLKLKFYTARKGNYFELGLLHESIEKAPKELQEALKTVKKKGAVCEVCALGGCFASMVNLGNSFTTKKAFGGNSIDEFDTNIDDSVFRGFIRKVFSKKQIVLIECAFEKASFPASFENISEHTDEIEQAISFGERHKGDEERMVAIMENIIKNKGEFKP